MPPAFVSNKVQQSSPPPPSPPKQIYVDSSTALIVAIEQVREFAGKFRGQPVRRRRWFYATSHPNVTKLIMLFKKERARSASGRMRGFRETESEPAGVTLQKIVLGSEGWPGLNVTALSPGGGSSSGQQASQDQLAVSKAACGSLPPPCRAAGACHWAIPGGPIYRSGCPEVHQ